MPIIRPTRIEREASEADRRRSGGQNTGLRMLVIFGFLSLLVAAALYWS